MAYLSFYWFICIAACFHLSIAINNETDKVALLEFKAGIRDDPLGIMSSWNDTLHFCDWGGVICAGTRQRVTTLNLESSKLTGTISPFVGNLSFLQVLDLQFNSFIGTIPSTIGRLNKLEQLLLNQNSISGVIPSNISGCSSLTVFEAGNNLLMGDIPPELTSLSNLQILSLLANNYTGEVPSFLGNLTSLSELYLLSNNFNGFNPDSLGKLTHLTVLSLATNKFSGTLPPSIFNLSTLTSLDISENELEGSLPPYLGITLPHLQFFSIVDNNFTGVIPASISNSTNLKILQLGGNRFHGQVPSLKKLDGIQSLGFANNFLGNGLDNDLDFVSSLANATMLNGFDISTNNFKGIFPDVICNFSMMTYFQCETNKIGGQLPSCIENLVHMEVFSVKGNQLVNVIPEEIGKLPNMSRLDLSGNKFSGNIPISMGNLTKLTILYMSDNNLQGNIPLTLGKCGNLQELNLSLNYLSGRIPIELLNLPSLSITLDLHHNRLSGSLPAEIGKLTNLGTLNVGDNMLSGVIPSTLGSCIGLERLYLGGNDFQGNIGDYLGTLKGLSVLDLSRNNFSGNIPKFLVRMQFQVLNLSYNNLEGEVPIGGVFNNATTVSIYGNKILCGGIPEFDLPKCDLNLTQETKTGHKTLILATLLGFAGVVLVLGVVLFYAFCLRSRNRKPRVSRDLASFPNVSYQSLVKGTNEFSAQNLIGSGTFGYVYKATLDPNSEMLVAVKVFNLKIHGGFKSFMAECGAIRNIKHRNLVKVITACSSVDHQGNDFKALVYEYMVNGSLDDWLHPRSISGFEDSKKSLRYLNSLQRLNIAVDVAFALDYLHHHCDAPIIHCDLKPSNVLLDDEMVAHVSDFGMAKLLSKDAISAHVSSVGVRGTIGYTPPEYGLGNEISIYGDVYSFGILVLELFTGRRPTDVSSNGGMSLREVVKADLYKHVTGILDPVVVEEIVGEEPSLSMVIMEAVISVLSIALACSADVPGVRLGMGDVATTLSSIRNNLVENCLLLRPISPKGTQGSSLLGADEEGNDVEIQSG